MLCMLHVIVCVQLYVSVFCHMCVRAVVFAVVCECGCGCVCVCVSVSVCCMGKCKEPPL
jgi:hypothetical protein